MEYNTKENTKKAFAKKAFLILQKLL